MKSDENIDKAVDVKYHDTLNNAKHGVLFIQGARCGNPLAEVLEGEFFMLKIMRKNAGSWVIKVIFTVIVIVFVFWGVGSFREDRADRVALVNGEAVSLQSYQVAYENAVENLRRQYGESLNRDVIKMFQIPRQVIESLINRQLMLQEAENLKISVSDKELAEAIQAMGAFQEAGVFNNRRYNVLLSQERLTPEVFEASLRQDLIINKINTFVTSGIKVTDGEILDWYEFAGASVDIDYVMFTPADIKDLDPTEEELESFYEANKAAYETEPQVKVRYLSFRPDRFVDDVIIPDEDVQDYYDLNVSEFKKEKTVEARHILLKADENAAPEIVEEQRKKAEDVMKKAREGRDFAELAKEFSEGPSGKDGGRLGEFKKGDMVAPFSDAAFSMAAGEISEPVQTQFGWHVIKVEKVNDATVSSLEDATADIREKLTKEASKTMAYDKAEDAFDQAQDDEDLEKTAAELNMELLSTDFFTEKGPATGFSDPALVASAAFDLSGSETSDVLNIRDNYFILQKTDAIPASIPNLTDVEASVRSDLVKKMQDEGAGKRAEEFLVMLKAGDGMETAAKDAGLEIHNSGFFKRDGPILDIGREAEIIRAAFLLSETKKIPDTVFKGGKGYYVIQFKARKSPDAAELGDQKEALKNKLISQKQEALFDQWIGDVRDASEISIEDRYLD